MMILFLSASLFTTANVILFDITKIAQAPPKILHIFMSCLKMSRNEKLSMLDKQSKPSQRLKQHILSPGNIEKLALIGKLVAEGKFPYMGVVDIVPLADASRIEQTYVYVFADFQRNNGQDISDVLLQNLDLNGTLTKQKASQHRLHRNSGVVHT